MEQAPPRAGRHCLRSPLRSSHPRAAAAARWREASNSPRAAQRPPPPPLRPQRPRRSPTAPPPERRVTARTRLPAAGSALDEARIPQPRREGRRPGGIRCQWPGGPGRGRPLDGGGRAERALPGTPLRAGPPLVPSGAPRAARGSPHSAGSPLYTRGGGGGKGGKAALRPKMASVSQATIPPRPARRRAAAPSSQGGCREGRRKEAGYLTVLRVQRGGGSGQAAPLPSSGLAGWGRGTGGSRAGGGASHRRTAAPHLSRWGKAGGRRAGMAARRAACRVERGSAPQRRLLPGGRGAGPRRGRGRAPCAGPHTPRAPVRLAHLQRGLAGTGPWRAPRGAAGGVHHSGGAPKFHLTMRKNLFTLRVAEHWNRLPRGVWSLLLWRPSKPTWTCSCPACSGRGGCTR
ncbi:uncharacterized protein FN964_008303 [Alca torda]